MSPRDHPARCGQTLRLLIMTLLTLNVCAALSGQDLDHGYGSRDGWGSECPQECQCHSTSLEHTRMAPWMRNHSIAQPSVLKAAVCVISSNTNTKRFFRKIPPDTQVLTLLQAEDSPPVVLMHQLNHLNNLVGLEVRGRGYNPNQDGEEDEVDDNNEGADEEGEGTTVNKQPDDAVDMDNVDTGDAYEAQEDSDLDDEGRPSRGQARDFALGADALRSFPELRYLSLTTVDMTALARAPFAKLRRLRSLHLRRNNLDSLPDDLFAGLTSLEELAVAENSVRFLPALAFAELHALRRLRLPDNQLNAIDAAALANLRGLRALDLAGNNLSDVSVLTFPPLSRLVSLRLDRNPIRVVFLQAFHALNATRTLTLGDGRTPIHVMKLSFAGLGRLKHLSLPCLDNEVLERGMFVGLSTLRSLTLTRSRAVAIASDAFHGAHNRLRSLSVTGGHRLRRLAPKALAGLSRLRNLDLSHNALCKLPDECFSNLPLLKHLDLRGNHLQFLPPSLSLPPHALRAEGNPWNCGCASLATWARLVAPVPAALTQKDGGPTNTKKTPSTMPYSSTKTRLICATPTELRGKRVWDTVRRSPHICP